MLVLYLVVHRLIERLENCLSVVQIVSIIIIITIDIIKAFIDCFPGCYEDLSRQILVTPWGTDYKAFIIAPKRKQTSGF